MRKSHVELFDNRNKFDDIMKTIQLKISFQIKLTFINVLLRELIMKLIFLILICIDIVFGGKCPPAEILAPSCGCSEVCLNTHLKLISKKY